MMEVFLCDKTELCLNSFTTHCTVHYVVVQSESSGVSKFQGCIPQWPSWATSAGSFVQRIGRIFTAVNLDESSL